MPCKQQNIETYRKRVDSNSCQIYSMACNAMRAKHGMGLTVQPLDGPLIVADDDATKLLGSVQSFPRCNFCGPGRAFAFFLVASTPARRFPCCCDYCCDQTGSCRIFRSQLYVKADLPNMHRRESHSGIRQPSGTCFAPG